MPVPCLPDQSAALLRLKRSFTITNDSQCTLASWRAGTDCCRWEGVRCGGANGDGRVRSLDLARCFLESAAIDPALFDLTSLRCMNIFFTPSYFEYPSLKSWARHWFERLKHLTHLNLSDASIQGKIPVGIRHLTNLVSLDLSTTFYLIDQDDYYLSFGTWSDPSWWVVEPNIGSLVANLSSLRELYLGRVDLSDNGEDWCTALTNSSTPQLQVLSLRHCRLFGPICTSLSSIHSLTEINLQYNDLYGPVPDSFADLHFLRVLDLADNDLEGLFPKRILQNRNLTTVHISYNTNIYGSLPNFSPDSSLTTLIVSSTNFSGPIPSSIGNLKSLNELGVASNDFRQELPSSIGQLTSLKLLEATGAGIVGTIPSWIANLTSLVLLRFSNCGLSGPIPSSIVRKREVCVRVSVWADKWYQNLVREMPKIGDGSKAVAGDDDNSKLVVQQVKEAGVTLRYPMLGENNYGIWAVKMKIFMHAQGVWAAVEGDAADEKIDQMALAAIVQAVPEAVVMAISEKETAKEAWDALKQMNMGEERVKKARVQTLKRELDGMYMSNSEKINDFALKVTTIVNEIRSLGTKVEETTVVEKLLHSVPDKFQPLISTIEQWGDVSEMTVTETIGRLRAFEESSKGQRRDKEGEQQLLAACAEPRLTRAEWEAKVAEESSGGSGSNGVGEKKFRGKFDKSKIECHRCGKFGHFADECDEPRKMTKAVVQLAIADADDEPTLL
ncbi:hypothetical protein OsJ_00468 [Oryza sativa Japonica Group]|uniref:non-specific serine/threonine protein kinase n=3 Tax=Oryza sativa subsp. japonica TaxID=39947 RepID=B9ESZ7_ORYSJ|nr:hypothetical protein OsJ_00468 [Oryza sativa Japonica Group]